MLNRMNDKMTTLIAGLMAIEELARRLFGKHHWDSINEIWEIEVDLLKFLAKVQKDLQKERHNYKKLRTRLRKQKESDERLSKDERANLREEIRFSMSRQQHLKLLHSYARQLGDALAWLVLLGDEKRIRSLGENAPIREMPLGYSLDAVVGVAKELLPHAGLPIIHDLTHCLRIGDITFSHPNHKEILTIEVKTRKLIKREGNQATLEIETYGVGDGMRFHTAFAAISSTETGEYRGKTFAGVPIGLTKQTKRQIERLHQAKQIEHVESIGVLGGENETKRLFVVAKEGSRHAHWGIVQELCNKAQKVGWACRVVDGAFLYLVTFAPNDAHSFDERIRLPEAHELTDCLKDSPFDLDPNNKRTWFNGTWKYLLEDPPLNVRPLFTYELQLDQILDILWRRLTITVFVDLPSVVHALKRAGMQTGKPPEGPPAPTSAVWKEWPSASGDHYYGGLSSFRPVLDRITLEFLSLDAAVDMAAALLEAMYKAASEGTSD